MAQSSLRILGAALIMVMMAAPLAFCQSYLGARFLYTVSTGVGTDVQEYGAPTRVAFGAEYTSVLSKRAEISGYAQYRIDNGGYRTPFVASTKMVQGGSIAVVDPNNGAPRVTTTINTSALEIGLRLGFAVADLDTSGSKFLITLGAFGDVILNAEQTDDYSAVPPLDRGNIPVTSTYSYDQQIGFGASAGVAIVLPLGGDRLVFDLGFMARAPTSFDYSNQEAGKPTQQNLGWLVGRGLRMGFAYQIGL